MSKTNNTYHTCADIKATEHNQLKATACTYQLTKDASWMQGVRVSYNGGTLDTVIGGNGEILGDIWNLSDCSSEGCFNLTIGDTES